MSDTNIRDEIAEIKEMVKESIEKKKPKKFRMPLKARVSKGKLKKGYITIMKVDDNKGVDFVREPIADGTFKLDDTFHAIKEKDILLYKAKPLIIQTKKGLNPFDPLSGPHETYGQKYVVARILGDAIAKKKAAINGMVIFVLIILAIGGYYWYSKGGGTGF